MRLREASDDDLPLLARWNRERIEDERADNAMSVVELEARLREHATRFHAP